VQVESKFCGNLGKNFKSRRNSEYNITMVGACLVCFRNSYEPVSLEENQHYEVRDVSGDHIL
jgi:hypothetical protein